MTDPSMTAPSMTAHAGSDLALAFGLDFADLYDRDGLVRIDGRFLDWLGEADAELRTRLLAGRADPDALDAKAESELLIALGPHLDDFLAVLFGIRGELTALQARHRELAPLYTVKRLFVQRRAAKAVTAEEAATLDPAPLLAALDLPAEPGTPAFELAFAHAVTAWEADAEGNAGRLDAAARYAAWALHAPEGRILHGAGLLFQVPRKTDPMHLVHPETITVDGVTMLQLPWEKRRHREGFALTDAGTDLAGALDQANYCIWCHNQGKDSCSKGLRDRKTGEFQKSPFGVTLAGCPLEEKISEFHALKAEGHPVGALAMIAVDNPLCAATGHRICNDCMKSCIYQKQQPVDIPQAETRTLKDVLALPWGFEIYGLLTRWNPLNLRRPLPRPESGYKVLVVGLGPAGFNLSHHLMNDGHTVVAIDGLKIEPLRPEVSGVDPLGNRVPFRPIRDISSLREPLDDRVMAGFGGVAEYGITVRWDKNFLKIVRLLLERRQAFAMIGGVRFGGTLTIDDAFAAGFDHVALCMGAGRPTVIPMRNGLARGVRQASDFLMALQLTGAARLDTLANLEVRLPIVVVGGGLTAIDTATESLAYYPVQVEKFLQRHEALAAEIGVDALRARWTEEEREVADEFIAHARALRAEREAAATEGRAPRIQELLAGWGGSTLAYRRRMVDAPSYTLNHEEVEKGFEEGIRFVETATPTAVEVDRFGHAAGLTVTLGDGTSKTLPARTILIAAGTQPNTVLAREDGRIELDGKYFRALDTDGRPVTPERLSKPAAVHVLMHGAGDGRYVSFFGDLHPSFAGNVVKAMGGAKQGYPVVSRILATRPPAALPTSPFDGLRVRSEETTAATGPHPEPVEGEGRRTPAQALIARMNHDLRAVVERVERLTPTIIEVVVRAPRAARRFEPGQFYRLQNFEVLAPKAAGTSLAMEGLALTGAWVDKDRGLLSTIVLEMGGSSDLCAYLKPGEPVILMGPTGEPTDIPAGETLCLVGGGLGNAVLFSIGQAARAQGNKVVYFAGYKKLIDRYKVEQIEAAADEVIWCSDEAPGFRPTRPRDKSFVGNIVQAMVAYAEGRLGEPGVALADVDRIVAIGSDRMMAAVAQARHGVLAPFLKPGHVGIGSINSPMQCMMKEICAQCLQLHKDPVTGEETVVFSCFNQDQSLDRVDWGVLRERLGQNSVQEKLTAAWIDRCLGARPWRQAAE